MSLYECTFITRQDIPVQDVHNLAAKFSEIVEKLEGNLKKKEYWGLRSFAYEIKKNKKGHYVILCFDASSIAIDELVRNFKINEDVLKYLVLKVDKIDEAPSPMMHAPAKAPIGAAQDEILN